MEVRKVNNELPEGWVWKTLGEVCDILSGYGFQKELQGKTTGDLPFYKVGDISQTWHSGNKYLATANNYISLEEAKEIRAKPFLPGTTVMAKIGEAIKLNRRALLSKPSLVDNNVMGIYPRPEYLDQKYNFYFLLTVKLGDYSQATTVPSVRKSDVSEIAFPLAPLDQQKLIVSEIEKQFSRLDEAVAAIKRVRAGLKRYKASVLKAAVEGKLTEEWRNRKGERPFALTKDETGADLLKRILIERRRKWEEEYIKKYVGAHGHAPKDDSWKKKYKEPSVPDTLNLPELPKGWVWVSLNIACSRIQDGSHFSPKVQYNEPGENRYLYITAKNVREHGMDISDVTYIDKSFHKSIFERCNPEKGDVLLVKDGVKTGIAAVNILDEEFSLLSSVALVKPYKTILISLYLKHYFNSPVGFKMITGQMTGTAIKRIILDKIRLSYVPLPPVLEQHKIVEEVESRLSVTEEIEEAIDINLKRAERLRQAILKKAFSGKLV